MARRAALHVDEPPNVSEARGTFFIDYETDGLAVLAISPNALLRTMEALRRAHEVWATASGCNITPACSACDKRAH